MKAWRLVFSVGVFLLTGLGFWFGRPEPIATQDFSFDSPTPSALAPLPLERENLELIGTIRDPGGSPAEDVLVALWPEASSALRPLAWTYSSGAGTFRLQNLAQGPHRVLLSAPGLPPLALGITLPHAGTVDWTLDAGAGHLEALAPIRWTKLEGRIERVAGALSTIDGLEVVLRPSEGGPELSGAAVRRATTDSEGRFAFDRLVAVDHVLEVLPPWARGGSWPTLCHVSVPGEREPVPLLVELPVGSLEGRLLEISGRPLEGALVTLTRTGAVDPLNAAQIWPPELTNFRGTFRFEMLPPGRYRLKLRAGAATREIEVPVQQGLHQVLDLAPMDPGSWR